MNFDEESDLAFWEKLDGGGDQLSWDQGIIWALEEVVNTLWAFGEDEHAKKMKVRQMLNDMRGQTNE